MLITDTQVRALITMPETIALMRHCFREFGHGDAAVLPRTRVQGASGSLSVMGAILEHSGVMGAKVYPTVDGRFNFIVNLFDARNGQFLASVEGNALTALRTPALTRVAVDALAAPGSRALAIFGSGVQARAHAEALLVGSGFDEVLVCAIEGAQAFAADIERLYRLPARVADAQEAAGEADVIVTCTRATEPVLRGAWLKPQACVAAIGSSKPGTREVDDETVTRSAVVAVEWREQSLREAGDLVLAGDRLDRSKVVELGELLVREGEARRWDGVRLFKSVGIGLADVALAHLAYRKLHGGR